MARLMRWSEMSGCMLIDDVDSLYVNRNKIVRINYLGIIDKDYEFSVDSELITLLESDPFYGYESETVVAHLTKLNDIATLFTHEEKKFITTISLSYFRSH